MKFKGRSTTMSQGLRSGVTGVLVASLLAASIPALAQAPSPTAAPYARPVAGAIILTPEQADLLRATLVASDRHGFAPGEFAPRGGDEAALVDATLRYAKAVKVGRLDVANFRSDWALRPQPFDARGGLARAVADNRLQAWLDALPPPYPGYETLQAGLTTYRDIQAKGGWRPLAAGPDLKIGAVGPAVEALRARLGVEDAAVPPVTAMTPPPPGQTAGQPLFDETLAEAVKRAQRRMGLEPSGTVGTATRAALNVTVERRIDQIVANMERWRWLPSSLPAKRVQVNVAAGVLTLFKNDQPALSMRAVTGKPGGGETPLLSSEIHSIVLNPPWNVPTSIATKELLPKGRAYLANAGFRILPGGGLQQRPGPNSALGLIKFDFNNPFAVYLHDTPSKGGFARYTRLVSHGCVRLERPLALARALMEGDPTWTPQQIDETIAGGETTRAKVADPVAVYLLYWTAYVTPDGQVNFRQDPYGWDALLIKRIAAQGGA